MGSLNNPVNAAALIAAHAAVTATHGSTALAGVKSGGYTGNDAVNWAIPHGLGVVPSLVIIQELSNACGIAHIVATAFIYYVAGAGAVGSVLAVTTPDATNFYVGNATAQSYSGNSSARSYRWAAVG